MMGRVVMKALLLLILITGGCGGGGGGSSAAVTSIFGIVDGYTDKISYNPGQKVVFYLNSFAEWSGNIGVYDILGKQVDSVSCTMGPQQIANPDPWENGYGYKPTVTYTVPASLKSGFYLLDSKIPFLVKDGSRQAEIVIVYPSNTEAAYNKSGGKNMYPSDGPDRAHIVSFQRPASPTLSNFCAPFLKWLAQGTTFSGKVRYLSDQDVDQYDEIAAAKVIVVIGHSEYWTRAARLNFDRFVDAGGNALILSGNTMWWQVRYSNDGSRMICYKNKDLDPVTDPLLKSVNWTEALLKLPTMNSLGGDFNHGGYGRDYPDRGWNGFKVVNPDSPIFAGTGLKKGDIISLPSMEYDGAPLMGFDAVGYPILDTAKLGFYQAEILGFDLGSRNNKETVGTMVAFRKSATSGIIINAASTDWCSSNGVGGIYANIVERLFTNTIDNLLAKTEF